MNDYISREAVINITAETGAWETQNRVRELPAADVQPVRHGRWEYCKNNGIFDTHKCTLCGEKYEMYMDIEPTTIYKYCPNCGADMTGGADDE